MNEANKNITNQPKNEPRSDALPNHEPPAPSPFAYEPARFAPPLAKSNTWLFMPRGVCIALVLCCCLICIIGLLIPALYKVRDTFGSYESIHNCKQMVLAVNNIAENSTGGYIPPSYGVFPPGTSTSQSFFMYLLPYLEQNSLYTNYASYGTTPVKTYIAPWDSFNPGTSGLISYGSNANLLTVGGQPTYPHSFNGRTSSIIVVFERTAKSGATWTSSTSYLFDQNGSSSPEFNDPKAWSGYRTRATALNGSQCVVGMGDGSCRTVTQNNATAGWAWAMDPSIKGNAPPGW